MRIRVTTRGGFTGMPDTQTLDVDKLSTSQQEHARKLLEHGFWNEPAAQKSAHPRPQDFDITLAVEDGDRQKTIQLHKNAASPALAAVLDWIDETLDGLA